MFDVPLILVRTTHRLEFDSLPGRATCRARLAPFCAIAVGRGGKAVDEQGGGTKHRTSSSSNHAHEVDGAAAAATDGSRGQWYGIQEIQEQRGITLTSGEGLGATQQLPRGKTASAATTQRSRSTKKGKGSKGSKGGKGGKGVKTMTNPTIGKTNLDRIIGDSAKLGVIPGVFGGDVERAQSEAAAKAKAEEVATAAAELEEEDEDDEACLTLTARWRRRITFVARTVQIWAFLFHVLIKLLRQKLVQRDEERMSARRRKLGRYLCKAFLKLGPTFIKIGQVCASQTTKKSLPGRSGTKS